MAAEPARMPHIVMLPFPAQGHVTPFVELAKRLASVGVTITFVNSEFHHIRMLECESQDVVNSLFVDMGIRLIAISDGLPLEDGRAGKLCLQTGRASEDCMRLEFEKVMQEKLLKEDPPITCIIADVMMSWTYNISAQLKLPQIYMWTASAASFLVIRHVDLLASEGYLPITDTNQNEIITCIPGVRPMRPTDLPSLLLLSDEYFRDFFPRKLKALTETDWVLVNSIYELEHASFDAMLGTKTVLFPVGPLFPPAFLDKGNLNSDRRGISIYKETWKCLEWLDTRQPASVIYLAFGSNAVLDPNQIEELASGLESSGQFFLWVFRPDFVEEGYPREILEGFINRTKNQGLIINWAPQLQVLSHPAIGGFLTHCGWNSTMETIWMGVPVLCWPSFFDQRMNCKWMVHHLEIGVELETTWDNNFVKREALERAVRVLMESEEGKEMRSRATRLKESLRVSQHTSQRNMDSFLQYLIDTHLKAKCQS